MDYQTWTRKANAIDAVKKILKDAPLEFVIESIDAHNVSVAGQEWAVTVEIDNPPSDADALQELLGNKARVKARFKALRPTPVPTAHEAWTAEMQSRSRINPADDARHAEESAHMGPTLDLSELQGAAEAMDREEAAAEWADAEAERLLAPKPARRSAAAERRLTCVAGKNPFMRGRSYDAWEWLSARPGTTYAECKAAGIRMRAISHAITMGWVACE